uniref:Nucleolar pre-ribosomal-associated protein 1 N-terminal domain-containing protein n=1 Tax=Aegilops tauschii TaxID=37682 RepID=N1QWF2_AEGTA
MEEVPKREQNLVKVGMDTWNQSFGAPSKTRLVHILKNLHTAEVKIYSDASREFIQLLGGDSGGEVLRDYVQQSPRLVELMEAWRLHREKPGMAYMLSLFATVLGNPGGKSRQHAFSKKCLDAVARTILEDKDKVGDVHRELNSGEFRRQNAALDLLAAIVRRGGGLASEVAESFDFKMALVTQLAGIQKKRGGRDGRNQKKKGANFGSTRRSLVGFAMSFLEVGNPKLLRWVLQQRELYSGVLRGIGEDDAETVVYVLSTLRDNVLVEESLVPPGLRSVLFGSATLEQLSLISGNLDPGEAADLAHQVLVMVCTDPKNGLMPSSHLRGNEKRLLDLMKKLHSTESIHHKNLLLAIVSKRLSFCTAYMNEFPYNVEPRPSPSWFAAISLAADIISSAQTDSIFHSFLSHDLVSVDDEQVQVVLKCIVPHVCSRAVINRGLQHSNDLVKHGSLRLVFESVNLLCYVTEAINGVVSSVGSTSEFSSSTKGKIRMNSFPGLSCSTATDAFLVDKLNQGDQMRVKRWISLREYIQDEVRGAIPDPQVLLKLLSSASQKHQNCSQSRLERRAQVSEPPQKKQRCNANDDIIIGGIDVEWAKNVSEEQDQDLASDPATTLCEIWGLDRQDVEMKGAEVVDSVFHSKLLDVLRLYLNFAEIDAWLVFLPGYVAKWCSILQISVLWLFVFFRNALGYLTLSLEVWNLRQIEGNLDVDEGKCQNHSISAELTALSTFLNVTPFCALLPSVLSLVFSGPAKTGEAHALLLDALVRLIRAKLYESTISELTFNLRVILFWSHRLLLSYTRKGSNVLEELCHVCSTLVDSIFERIRVLAANTADLNASAECFQDIVESVLHHPTIDLPRSLSNCPDLTDGSAEHVEEAFTSFSKENLHLVDGFVVNLLSKLYDLLLLAGNDGQSLESLFASPKVMLEKILLLFKDKFEVCMDNGNFGLLLPNFYMVRALKKFMSPVRLLELVNWMFSELESRGSSCSAAFAPAAFVCLSVADIAMELLYDYLQQTDQRSESCQLWGLEIRSSDIATIQRVYHFILHFTAKLNLESADVCLLKMLIRIHNAERSAGQNTEYTAFHMMLSTMATNTPLSILHHCMFPTSKVKAKVLWLLLEVSPIHMNFFGQMLMKVLEEDTSILQGMDYNSDSSRAHEDSSILLLPAALSYMRHHSDGHMQCAEFLEPLANFYCEMLLGDNGFPCWKSFITRSIFEENFGDFQHESVQDMMDYFSDTLLGKSVTMLHYCLSLKEMPRKQRLEIVASLCPQSSGLLDSDVNDINPDSHKGISPDVMVYPTLINNKGSSNETASDRESKRKGSPADEILELILGHSHFLSSITCSEVSEYSAAFNATGSLLQPAPGILKSVDSLFTKKSEFHICIAEKRKIEMIRLLRILYDIKSRQQKIHKTENTESNSRRRAALFRENIPIDSKLCVMTVLQFCYKRSSRTSVFSLEQLRQDKFDDILKTTSRSIDMVRIYDPMFILCFLIHTLLMGYIEPAEFSRVGLLAITLVSISSPDEELRKLGYESLNTFKKSLEASQKSKEKWQLQLLLTYLQNGISKPWQRIPSIIAIFTAEASLTLLDSTHTQFNTISNFLMNSASVDMQSIPLFPTLLKSSSVHFKADRLWMLRLLYAGSNLADDATICKNKSVLELALAFCSSAISDSESKHLILQVLKKCAKLPVLAQHLVKTCGLLSWISSVISTQDKGLDNNSSSRIAGLALEVLNALILSRFITDKSRSVMVVSWVTSNIFWLCKQKSAAEMSCEEPLNNECLLSKILRWLVASVILGRISRISPEKRGGLATSTNSPGTLQSFLNHSSETFEMADSHVADEALAAIILYLQGHVKKKSDTLPSVVTALSLLLVDRCSEQAADKSKRFARRYIAPPNLIPHGDGIPVLSVGDIDKSGLFQWERDSVFSGTATPNVVVFLGSVGGGRVVFFLGYRAEKVLSQVKIRPPQYTVGALVCLNGFDLHIDVVLVAKGFDHWSYGAAGRIMCEFACSMRTVLHEARSTFSCCSCSRRKTTFGPPEEDRRDVLGRAGDRRWAPRPGAGGERRKLFGLLVKEGRQALGPGGDRQAGCWN